MIEPCAIFQSTWVMLKRQSLVSIHGEDCPANKESKDYHAEMMDMEESERLL